jgi:hypothetical protein
MAISHYKEINGKERWQNTIPQVLPIQKEIYPDGEKSVQDGTARQIKTITRGERVPRRMVIPIFRKGKYGVYVSYQNSTGTVQTTRLQACIHAVEGPISGSTQQIGGGTWIFLGYFYSTKEIIIK